MMRIACEIPKQCWCIHCVQVDSLFLSLVALKRKHATEYAIAIVIVLLLLLLEMEDGMDVKMDEKKGGVGGMRYDGGREVVGKGASEFEVGGGRMRQTKM